MRSASLVGVVTVLLLTPSVGWSPPLPPSRPPNSAWIEAAAVSPDGKYVAFGFQAFKPKEGMDKFPFVQLVDLGSRKVVRHFVGHKDQVKSLSFVAGGKQLLSVSKDGTARLWDVGNGKLVRTLTLPLGDHTGAWPSPDGKRLLAWELRTASPKRKQGKEVNLPAPQAGFVLPTTPTEYYFHIYDLESGAKLRTFQTPFRVSDMRFSRNGKRAVLIGLGIPPQLLDITKEKAILSVGGGKEWCSSESCLTADGRFIVTDMAERRAPPPYPKDLRTYLGLWDTRRGVCVRRFEAREVPSDAYSIVMTPDGKGVLTVDTDGWTRRWDMATGKEVWSIRDLRPKPWERLGSTPMFVQGGKQFVLFRVEVPGAIGRSQKTRFCFYDLKDGKALRDFTFEFKCE